MDAAYAEDARGVAGGVSSLFVQWRADFSRKFQFYLGKLTPHGAWRWLASFFFAVIYSLCVYFGFYIVTYGLGIYLLNLLIAFLSPQVDPETEGPKGPTLPSKGFDEFKPFICRLPKFKFCFSNVLLLIVCTTLLYVGWLTIHDYGCVLPGIIYANLRHTSVNTRKTTSVVRVLNALLNK